MLWQGAGVSAVTMAEASEEPLVKSEDEDDVRSGPAARLVYN